MITRGVRTRRKRRTPGTVRVLLALVLALVILPMVLPMPPLRGVKPVRELGGSTSFWVTIDGLNFHQVIQGDGEPAFVLVHGFGASTFSWRYVIEGLRELGTVLAYDRPGFGLTERLPADGTAIADVYAPTSEADHLLALMDAAGIEAAVLVAHSVGSGPALEVAQYSPGRVKALVLIAPSLPTPRRTAPLLSWLIDIPQIDRIGPIVMRLTPPLLQRGLREAWSDADALPDDVLSGYRVPLQAEDWDQGLWQVLRARLRSDHQPVPGAPGMDVLVVTGDMDRIVRLRDSQRTAADFDAPLVVMEQTGHLPHEEDPETFLSILLGFLQDHRIIP